MYTIIKSVGVSRYGIVRLAHPVQDPNIFVIIKTLNTAKFKGKTEDIMEELLMMKLANHKQVVNTIAIFKEDDES